MPANPGFDCSTQAACDSAELDAWLVKAGLRRSRKARTPSPPSCPAAQAEIASASASKWAESSLRAPLSNVLLWLEGAEGVGACTGDSGAPVFSGGAVVGIVAYAQAARGRGCGGLTQAVRIAPHAAWVESVVKGWR